MRHADAEFTLPAQSLRGLQLRSFGGVRSDTIDDVSHASRLTSLPTMLEHARSDECGCP